MRILNSHVTPVDIPHCYAPLGSYHGNLIGSIGLAASSESTFGTWRTESWFSCFPAYTDGAHEGNYHYVDTMGECLLWCREQTVLDYITTTDR
jgi:hypothetical protein